MDSILTHPDSWLSLLGTVALLIGTYIANRYVVPFLKIGKRQKYAQFIATIADEMTDDLRNKYPDEEWLKHLDEAVDRLIDVCGISSEIARRAISAATVRK